VKKLFLIRHAKSAWDDPALADFDRPLSDRGRKDAKAIGRRLKKAGILPDRVDSSAAKRAKSTTKFICEELGCEDKAVLLDGLYAASAEDMKSIIARTPNDVAVLVVVSHNPGLNELAFDLVGYGDNVPTAGVLEIWFDMDRWDRVDSAGRELKNQYFPKNS
jgi:phosphohistidine phosphatase